MSRQILRRYFRTVAVRSSSQKSAFNPLAAAESARHPVFDPDPPAVRDVDPWDTSSNYHKNKKTLTELDSKSSALPKDLDGILAEPHPENHPPTEPIESLKKRLIWMSSKRGILEMEIILGAWVRENVESWGEEARLVDRFLTLPDWTLYYYLTAPLAAEDAIPVVSQEEASIDKVQSEIGLRNASATMTKTGEIIIPEPWKSSWVVRELREYVITRTRSENRQR